MNIIPIICFLLVLPFAAGILMLMKASLKLKYSVSLAVSALHLVVSYLIFARIIIPGDLYYVSFDPLSRFFLLILSNAYFWVTLNSYGYLNRSMPFDTDESKKLFYGLLNLYLAANSLALLSNHWGIYWVALEATTLCTAPLIYYYRSRQSLEAMWKYLFVVSVGIAFAFMGILFLALASRGVSGVQNTLFFADLVREASKLNPIWLKAGFIFIFVGLCTKAGIAPMHPGEVDAVSNSPSPVAALMSATLNATALMGMIRILQIVAPTQISGFARTVMIAGGVLSLSVAFFYLFKTGNYKRMIAYSSVEHYGLIVIGIASGGAALFGAFLQLLYNSLAKTSLFFMAGNVHTHYQSREIADISGMKKKLPWTGMLFFLSFLAVAAMPPFGIFFSELMIFQGLFEKGHISLLILLLVMLLFVFIGLSRLVFRMLFNPAEENEQPKCEEKAGLSHYSAAILLCVLAVLGLFMPQELYNTVREITVMLDYK